jgi:hypothetical protein
METYFTLRNLPRIIGLLPVIFLLFSISAFAQDVRFRASSFSSCSVIDEKWAEYQDCSVLIIMTGAAEKIVIYSNELQVIDVYRFDGIEKIDGREVYTLRGVDQKGQEVTVRHVVTPAKKHKIYVHYPLQVVVYNVSIIPGS